MVIVNPAAAVTSWIWRPGTVFGLGSERLATRRGVRGLVRRAAPEPATDAVSPLFADGAAKPGSAFDASPCAVLPTCPPLPDGECPGVQGTIAIARPLERPTATGFTPPAMPSSSPAVMPATPPRTDQEVPTRWATTGVESLYEVSQDMPTAVTLPPTTAMSRRIDPPLAVICMFGSIVQAWPFQWATMPADGPGDLPEADGPGVALGQHRDAREDDRAAAVQGGPMPRGSDALLEQRPVAGLGLDPPDSPRGVVGCRRHGGECREPTERRRGQAPAGVRGPRIGDRMLARQVGAEAHREGDLRTDLGDVGERPAVRQ